MRIQKKRSLLFLLLSLVLGILIVLAVLYIPPTFTFPLWQYQLSIVYGFLFLVFFFLFFLSAFIFRSQTHGILIAAFVVCYLVFRLNNLTHPLFLLLLAGIFVVLELFFSFKK